jgi:WD40 repeat protein
MSRVWLPSTLIAALCAALHGCGGDVLTLGRRDPNLPVFGEVTNHSRELGTGDNNEDNPSLTADLLQIFFTSNVSDGNDTGVDVFTARRETPDGPFGQPVRLTSVSTDGFDTSPSISFDGSTLWVGSEVPNSEEGDDNDEDLDIYRFTRSSPDSDDWSDRTPETALNSSAKDIPRPLALNDTVMPLGSQRDDDGTYLTYLAERPGPGEPFGEPRLLSELVASDRATVDAFLSNDGRLLFFNWEAGAGKGDLYMAWRRSVDEPFSGPLRLDDINGDGDERDPWLSPDGTRFFFTSDRDSTDADDPQLDIFEVPIELPSFD